MLNVFQLSYRALRFLQTRFKLKGISGISISSAPRLPLFLVRMTSLRKIKYSYYELRWGIKMYGFNADCASISKNYI